jgi:cytochrome c biogenesis protein CcmG/thiol:disulfide interchange protein DsbE
LLGLVALFAWQLAHRDDNAFRDALRAGHQPEAPAFALPRLDSSGTISSKGLAGHAAVLNFWASWCPPCADEAPDLNALSVRYGSLGVRFVGVDFNDAVDEARAFARRHDVPYALVHDTSGVRQAFGVSAPPETYVIDGSGRAVVRIEGPVDTPLLEPYVRLAAARSGQAVPLEPDVRVGGKSLASLRGTPLLLAFVAPGCSSCATLVQRLSELGGRARVVVLSEGGEVAGSVADPPDTAGRGGGKAQRALGITSFPTLLAIDARGRLVAAPIGLPGAATLSEALKRAGAS